MLGWGRLAFRGNVLSRDSFRARTCKIPIGRAGQVCWESAPLHKHLPLSLLQALSECASHCTAPISACNCSDDWPVWADSLLRRDRFGTYDKDVVSAKPKKKLHKTWLFGKHTRLDDVHQCTFSTKGVSNRKQDLSLVRQLAH